MSFSLINNNSKLPTNLNHVTDRCLFSVTFSAGDIAKIIQNNSSNIAHGHDNFSIRVLKICGDNINKPLEQALVTGTYPLDWKKANIVPVRKKGDKQNIKKYHPVSFTTNTRQSF